MSEAVYPVSRTAARHMLDQAGYPDQALPRMGYLVPLDGDMNSWIENRGGRLEVVVWAKLAKPAWLSPTVPTGDVGAYLRREGRYRSW